MIAPHNIEHIDVDRVGWSSGQNDLAAIEHPINELVGFDLNPTFPKNKTSAKDGSNCVDIDHIIVFSCDHFRKF